MTDIGQLTHDLRSGAKDIFETWMRMPYRRADYGARELLDIRETYLGLGVLLREIEKAERRAA